MKGEKAIFCAKHKKSNMIDVNNRRCEEANCPKNPNFGLEGGKARFCADHKQSDMINVISRRCEEANCNKIPIFGVQSNKPRFCADHKKSDMFDVINRCCEEINCQKQPNFGVEGKKARFCMEHKESDMINVVSRRCEEASCQKHPHFGVEGEKARFCVEHKLPGMIDVQSRRCEEASCQKQPVYGLEGEKSRFCVEHKESDMIDVVNRRCESEACCFYQFRNRNFASYRIDAKHLCRSCFANLYPERKRLKVRKEHFILSEIERRVPELCEYRAIWDCALGNCVLAKPDMYWFIGHIGIHLEIDERGLDHEDDDHRVAEIHTASGMDGTFLIRFNPDEYSNKDGNKVSSCFRHIRLATGPRLRATPEFKRRMDILEDVMYEKLWHAEAGEVPSQESWKTRLFF